MNKKFAKIHHYNNIHNARRTAPPELESRMEGNYLLFFVIYNEIGDTIHAQKG